MSVIIKDPFDEAGSSAVALASHTITNGGGVNATGTSWTDANGAFQVAGSHGDFVTASAGGTNNIAYLDAGQADYTLSCQVKPGHVSTSEICGVVVRYDPATDAYWQVVLYDDSGTNKFEVYERTGATNTLRDSIAFAFSAGTLYTITATVQGTSLTATVNGGSRALSATMGTGAGRTKCGMRSVQSTASDTFAAFEVDSPAGAPFPPWPVVAGQPWHQFSEDW